jgi:putative endonuclease
MVAECYWVYILHCDNNTYYTGYTTDVVRRYQDHLKGKCKYTRSFKPLSIAQCWQIHSDKSTAMKIENHIKRLSKDKKTELIKNPEILNQVFEYATPGKSTLL